MAGRLPDRRVHDNRGIESDDIFAVASHRAPPGVAQIALQLGAEWAVIPEAIDAAVDLGALENEAAPLAQGYDLLHQRDFFGRAHVRQDWISGKKGGEGARAYGAPQEGNRRGDLQLAPKWVVQA